MSDINKIIIIGRLTKDPELKYTQSGTSIASFSIANNKTWMQDGAKKDQTSFFNCTSWGKQGETIAKYFKKGSRIALEGRLQQRSWDGSDGKKHYAVDIVVENFNFLDSKKSEGGQDNIPREPPTTTNYESDNPFSDEDSIPF